MNDQAKSTDSAEPAEPQVNLLLLPVTMRRLVRLVGQRQAFELCKLKGGTDIKVPATFQPEHWLVGVIGHAGLANLVAEAGGESLHVPKYDKVMVQLRHQQVHGLVRENRSLAEMMQLTGYARRQLFNIRQELDEAEGVCNTQGDLFGDAPEEPVFEEPSVPAHDPFGIRKLL